MKATVDIPDALYRRVKARSALEGRAIREVTIELYERWLDEERSPAGHGAQSAEQSELTDAAAWLAEWERIGDEVARRSVDPRTSREILLAERR
jgi:hypothetical protein